MTTITTAEAAIRANVTPHTIRTWCRNGQLAATKQRGRWVIRVSALARLLCPVSDRLRKGVASRPRGARATSRLVQRAAARLLASEHGTRVIGHQQRARIACANSGHTLVRDYLVWLGCEETFVAKYESAFGRAVAKTYRSNHHAEPETGGLVVLRGRLWRTMRYSDIRDLHRGARAYTRTADMFGLVA